MRMVPQSTPLILVWLEKGINCNSGETAEAPSVLPLNPVLIFYQNNYTTAFRSLISKRCELGNLCEIHDICIINRDQFDSLPVAQSYGASFVKEQYINISSRFDTLFLMS